MIWGGKWERGSCLGTHVHPWWIQVNVWQNQYSIVKKKKQFTIKKNAIIKTTKQKIIWREVLTT